MERREVVRLQLAAMVKKSWPCPRQWLKIGGENPEQRETSARKGQSWCPDKGSVHRPAVLRRAQFYRPVRLLIIFQGLD
jgi:hypothetical protein